MAAFTIQLSEHGGLKQPIQIHFLFDGTNYPHMYVIDPKILSATNSFTQQSLYEGAPLEDTEASSSRVEEMDCQSLH